MERHPHCAGADRGLDAGGAEPLETTFGGHGDDGQIPSGSPSRRRSAFASPTSWRWIAAIPTSPSISSAGSTGPGQPRGRDVEPARILRQSQRRSVDGGPRIVTGIPAGEQRWRVQELRPHHAEGGPTRRHKPLVRGARHEVEAGGVEGQPANGLRGVEVRKTAVLGGGQGEALEPAGDVPPIRGLHRAHRDEMHARTNGLDQAIQRDGLDADTTIGVRQEGTGPRRNSPRRRARARRQAARPRPTR